jgi:hypothetical protein
LAANRPATSKLTTIQINDLGARLPNCLLADSCDNDITLKPRTIETSQPLNHNEFRGMANQMARRRRTMGRGRSEPNIDEYGVYAGGRKSFCRLMAIPKADMTNIKKRRTNIKKRRGRRRYPVAAKTERETIVTRRCKAISTEENRRRAWIFL